MKDRRKEIKIEEADRPFETVGEAVRHEVMFEVKAVLTNEIADACIKGEPTNRLTRIYNLLTKEDKGV